ncbi:MAG TPA: polysaccharide deacetylase family protein, partial [Anaerolineales bacterium]|nr:polysaccharide deacetylase family protein [Anaerolineales bacterium]
PTPEPPALPVPYQASLLNPLDSPHTYIPEPCQYIKDKWSSANSAPGTVVMVIMFHIITNDALANPDQISEFNFRRLMKKIYTDGFQAITTAQLAGFLYHNAKIPERSVLLVVDDRKTRQYFERFFQQYWDDYHWPVVNAWISTPLSTADLWQQQVDLEAAGWVDHQAHGVVHDIPIDSTSSDEYILGELQGSIDAFKLHFDKTPIAFIWPGGGFTPHAAALARQVGYQLGFTINPRGPLMYNWVPLADSGDPVRPTWIPEGPVNDPLMVLPRYWDTDAALHLDEVVQMSGEAAAYADQNKATEMEYYDIVCASQYGPIP